MHIKWRVVMCDRKRERLISPAGETLLLRTSTPWLMGPYGEVWAPADAEQSVGKGATSSCACVWNSQSLSVFVCVCVCGSKSQTRWLKRNNIWFCSYFCRNDEVNKWAHTKSTKGLSGLMVTKVSITPTQHKDVCSSGFALALKCSLTWTH